MPYLPLTVNLTVVFWRFCAYGEPSAGDFDCNIALWYFLLQKHRRKGIVTGFVRAAMPLAEDIVLEWITYATEVLELKPNDPIFPKTRIAPSPQTGAFETQGLSNEHWANTQPVREIFKEAFKSKNERYFNPHLFRNTVIQWALKNCTQYEFKALSQNFGHEHAMTTYNAMEI